MKHIASEALIYTFLTGERYPDSRTVVVLNVEQLYGRLEEMCQACGIKEQDARNLLETKKTS